MRIPFMRSVSWYLVVAMFLIAIAPRVEAGMVPSEIIALSQADRAADIEKIRQVLELKAVGERLRQLGLDQEEVKARLAELSDHQIHQLALQIDDIRIGQGDVFGVIIALLVIAILVVVLLKLTGHRVFVTR